MVEQVTVVVHVPAMSVLHVPIHTHVLGAMFVCVMTRHEVARVLRRPARGTGAGGGHHEGGCLGGAAHGAGDVLLVVTGDVLILCPVDDGVRGWESHVVQLGVQDQTQVIGRSACVFVEPPAHYTCIDNTYG